MKPLAIIAFLFSQTLWSQTIWTDSLGGVSNLTGGVWFGDTSLFIVNSVKQLQLQASGGGSSRLYRSSNAGYLGTWKFFFKMDFNPSSSNHCRIFLAKEGNSGLYIAFGEGGRDALELGLTNNGQDSVLGSSPPILDTSTSSGVVSITSDSTGIFRVLWSPDWIPDSTVFYAQGPASLPSSTLEITCTYTSTRSDKFYFDDFWVSGWSHRDLHPPKILDLQRGDDEFIIITVSTPVSCGPLLWSNGEVALIDSIEGIQQLRIYKPVERGVWTLGLGEVTDTLGRTLDSILVHFQLGPYSDQVFPTEILPDPTPSRGLPEKEFLEIMATRDLQLPPGILVINDDSIPTPSHHLKANIPTIIAAEPYPSLQSTWTIPEFYLPNDSANIEWYDYNNDLVWQLRYDSRVHHQKGSEGGYSLENLSSFPQCPCPENWFTTPSTSGGNPGEYQGHGNVWNSYQALWFIEEERVYISAQAPLIPKRIKAAWKSENRPFEIMWNPDLPHYFSAPLPLHSSDSLILYDSLLACSGEPVPNSYFFSWPQSPGLGTITKPIITEVLFDENQFSEFIEIGNPNEFAIGLTNGWIGEIWNEVYYRNDRIWDAHRTYILPGYSVVALTDQIHKVKREHNRIPQLIPMHNWASLSNSEGSVVLELSRCFLEMSYNRSLHSQALDQTEDYSLSKQNGMDGPWVSVWGGSPGWLSHQHFNNEQSLWVQPRVLYPNSAPLNIQVIPPTEQEEYSIYLSDATGRVLIEWSTSQRGPSHWTFNGKTLQGKPLAAGPYYVISKFKSHLEIKKCAIAP